MKEESGHVTIKHRKILIAEEVGRPMRSRDVSEKKKARGPNRQRDCGKWYLVNIASGEERNSRIEGVSMW